MGPAGGSVQQRRLAAFFAGHPFEAAVFGVVRATVDGFGPCEVRVTKSQVSFRRRRAFAWVWRPGRWLVDPSAEVVVSFALRRREGSLRIKESVEPRPGWWMHHLEVHDLHDLDAEVNRWLREAYDAAG
jgi:hypothetical protein